MSHRKLTEGCLFALRAIAEKGGAIDVHNRTIAHNLRIIERAFPQLVIITPPPRDRGANRPLFGAALTERGRDFITPRKVARARAQTVEVVQP